MLLATLGHKAVECKENRALDWSKVPDMDPEDAWNKVAKADVERDLDDLREVRNPISCQYHCDVLLMLTYRRLSRSMSKLSLQPTSTSWRALFATSASTPTLSHL